MKLVKLAIFAIVAYFSWVIIFPHFIGYSQGRIVNIKHYGFFDRNLPYITIEIQNFDAGKNYLYENGFEVEENATIERVSISATKQYTRWPFVYITRIQVLSLNDDAEKYFNHFIEGSPNSSFRSLDSLSKVWRVPRGESYLFVFTMRIFRPSSIGI